MFVFFLFLLGVTCLVYYLPGKRPSEDLEGQDFQPRPLQCYVTVTSADVKEAPIDHV